jgi:alkylation response protein AidB-like acyl-CoA dehydrogenase
MDFSISVELVEEVKAFKRFLESQLVPYMSAWYDQGSVPPTFHRAMADAGWLNFRVENGRLTKKSALRGSLIAEALATRSPGVAVASLAHTDLGLSALWLWGSAALKEKYGQAAVRGETLMCLGNTENVAGSDVANIATRAQKVSEGWRLKGTKAYVTNGLVSHMAVVTAVSDPEAPRNKRISMFLVDLDAEGVQRRKLHKQVWIPSDLSRITLDDVFVPEDHLMGTRGQGLQQVLSVFTHSRVPISALTLGTSLGAFELAREHAGKRDIFGKKIITYQAKAFEMADLYAKIEAARLMVLRACWAMDEGRDFRLESSLAKYLTVMTAREVSTWAADLFGAASVVFEHGIHKFPLDAWASSLGEGTQDVQKLIIFREMLKRCE